MAIVWRVHARIASVKAYITAWDMHEGLDNRAHRARALVQPGKSSATHAFHHVDGRSMHARGDTNDSPSMLRLLCSCAVVKNVPAKHAHVGC